MHWPDPTSLFAFLAIVAFVAGSVVFAFGWSAPRERRPRDVSLAAVAVAAWMALTGAMAGSGIFQVAEPFLRLAPLVGTLFVSAFALGLSPLGRRLADHVPVALLVGFHAFRLPLELVLHEWAAQGTVPHAMAFSGQNFDIVAGVLALVVAPFARRAPWLVLIFEIVGIALLLNIFRIIASSVPGAPLYVHSAEPALLLPVHFPTIWIATVCVFFAIVGHVVLARWLWSNLRSRPESA